MRFDREIGPERELRAGPQHRLPRIGAFQPRRIESLLRHQPVARLVGRLHRRDDVRPADPGQGLAGQVAGKVDGDLTGPGDMAGTAGRRHLADGDVEVAGDDLLHLVDRRGAARLRPPPSGGTRTRLARACIEVIATR